MSELVPLSGKPLSSREINVAKRKARQAAFSKQKSRDSTVSNSADDPPTPLTPIDEPDLKKIKFEQPDEFLSECYFPFDASFFKLLFRRFIVPIGHALTTISGNLRNYVDTAFFF